MEEMPAKDEDDFNNKPKGKEEKKEKDNKDKGKDDKEVRAHSSIKYIFVDFIITFSGISLFKLIRIWNKHWFHCFKPSLISSIRNNAGHSVNQCHFILNHRKRRQV